MISGEDEEDEVGDVDQHVNTPKVNEHGHDEPVVSVCALYPRMAAQEAHILSHAYDTVGPPG